MLEVRRKGVQIKKMERYNEDFAAHQENVNDDDAENGGEAGYYGMLERIETRDGENLKAMQAKLMGEDVLPSE
jgi:hypothetical protein